MVLFIFNHSDARIILSPFLNFQTYMGTYVENGLPKYCFRFSLDTSNYMLCKPTSSNVVVSTRIQYELRIFTDSPSHLENSFQNTCIFKKKCF